MLASLAKREAAQDEARRFAIRLTRIRIEGDDLVLIRLASVPKSCASCTLSKAPFASAHNSRSEADHVFLISFSARVGFKVYSSPTEVGPLHPFTCIIGPNGIGKSVLVNKALSLHFAIFFASKLLVTFANISIFTQCRERPWPLLLAQVLVGSALKL